MSSSGREAHALERPQTVRIDPHLHTSASYDGYTTPEQVVRRAETVGLDGVVVTDHDTIEGAEAVAERAVGRDLLVIVGCEVSTADGHLLAIGVDDAPEPGRPLQETARQVAAEGGLAVVPHPFQRSRHGAGRTAIDDVDGVEVYNAHALTNFRNGQAAQFANERGYPGYGGSDAHRPGGIGRAETVVELPAGAECSADAVLEAMRAGRTTPVPRRSNRGRYVAKLVDSATRKTLSLL